ncbi:MAG: hypothetical protein DCC49_04780 [Acidobacteria bacterium]|nr:MAG: hypothetical protein DCC49_04780 [Acidobacteriota bacterium]
MPRDSLAYVIDMIRAAETALRLIAGFDESEFLDDERTRWAVYSQIIVIGEAASRVPRDFCDRYQEIPWSEAAGMRHRLVHGYDSVDWSRVWLTLQRDLPPLLYQLGTLLPNDENGDLQAF